jgi:hypothetical protein
MHFLFTAGPVTPQWRNQAPPKTLKEGIMTRAHCRFSLSSRTTVFLGALTVLSIFATTLRWAPAAYAQEPVSALEQLSAQEREDLYPNVSAITPSVALQYASVVSAGSTITISRAPVTTSTGVIVYKDITLQLAVGANGQITVASGYPKYAASPNMVVAGFKTGTYVSSAAVDSGKMGFVLSGPGIGTNVSVWSIATTSAFDSCSVPPTATFYVGPLTSNPLYTRLKKAGITSTNMSYGLLGTQLCVPAGINSSNWRTNSIIGLSQIGNTITISSFTLYGDTDQSTPLDEFTFTLK